jgi:hypothetical protein
MFSWLSVMKLLKPFIVLLLCLGYSVLAQEDTLAPPGVLSTGDVLVASSDYPQDHLWNITKLWLLDPFVVGGQQRLYMNIEREAYRVHDVEIARGGQYLFTLEIEGREDTGFVPLGESQLVRMNLETGEREMMFAGSNLVNFSLSPNAEQALVRFYPADMTFADRYDVSLRQQWCVGVFSFDQDDCHVLTFDEDTYLEAFEWVSNSSLVYTLNYQDTVQVLDTTTFTTEIIPLPDGFHASEIRSIPGQNDQLLVYDAPFTEDEVGKLLLLDLNHKSFREIAEIPISSSIIEVSPNGDYAVMAGGYPPQAILIDLRNGSVIQSYPTIYDMQWTSFQWLPTDHTLFLVGNLGYRGGNVMTIVLEPFTSSTTNIIDDVGGTLIVVP